MRPSTYRNIDLINCLNQANKQSHPEPPAICPSNPFPHQYLKLMLQVGTALPETLALYSLNQKIRGLALIVSSKIILFSLL